MGARLTLPKGETADWVLDHPALTDCLDGEIDWATRTITTWQSVAALKAELWDMVGQLADMAEPLDEMKSAGGSMAAITRWIGMVEEI